VDCHSPEQRRKNMQAIRSNDTSIELMLRKELWRRGIRYRKNCKIIAGSPDLVFIGKKVAVFCDSDFWHGRNWEEKKTGIKSNRDYWIPKIERNIQRDADVNLKLVSDGWIVLRFWESEIRSSVSECADGIEKCLNNR